MKHSCAPRQAARGQRKSLSAVTARGARGALVDIAKPRAVELADSEGSSAHGLIGSSRKVSSPTPPGASRPPSGPHGLSGMDIYHARLLLLRDGGRLHDVVGAAQELTWYVAHVAQGGVEVRDGRSVHFPNDMPRGVVDEAFTGGHSTHQTDGRYVVTSLNEPTIHRRNREDIKMDLEARSEGTVRTAPRR
ncbi:hypothetical protein ONZ51_g3047 [Trametes cubensis]|uniref:Uncharacterized protein n=1 Tax=Trametes cubensis TaxID=1111947 RepID=A0AAD7TZ01_9APHY|nr:hypothetical protein ONZ51_g3047 [Trametes cubensis]